MMLKTLPKFLLAAFTLFLFQNLKAQNETEPNNTAATANTLTLNGSGKGIINPVGDVDWYKVTTTADGRLDITVNDLSNADYLHFTLFDHDGGTALGAANATTNNTATVSADGLAAGTYYVQVTGYNPGDTATYTLSNTLTPASVANDAEPDSTRAQALVLPLDGSKTGHIGYLYNNHRDSVDWYKVTTNADGLLRITLTDIPTTANDYIHIELRDNNGLTYLSSANATSNPAVISYDGLAAGTYYLIVTPYNNGNFAPYTVADSLFTPSVANDTEPDSTRAQALTLPLDGSKTGHIGYYYNNHQDSSDWYMITTNNDGLLRLTLTDIPTTVNDYIHMELRDNNGLTYLSSANATSNPAVISYDGLAAGTYYVIVTPYNNGNFAPYTIADSLFTTVANDAEPDSNRATALTLPLNSSKTGHIGYYYNNHQDSADWYKVSLNQDGALQIRLTDYPTSANDYIHVQVYDNDGLTVLNSGNATSNPAIITTDGLAKGTYYISVTPYNNGNYAPYAILDTLYTYQYVEDSTYEPNNTASLAKTIPSDRTTTGHIGFNYNGNSDDADWFKINYTGTGNLDLKVNLLPHVSNGNVNYITYYVYRDTSAASIYQTNITSTTSTTVANLTGLTEGYYYVKITPYNTNDFAAYSLLDSFVQVDKALISINSAKTTINSSTCGADSITYNLSGSHSPYTVRLYKNGAFYDSVVTIATTATFKGLSAGSYYATVYGDGATDAAYSKSATSTATPPVPTALSTTNIGVHTATLNWTKLSCANYYTVQYRMVGTQTWTVINTKGDTSKLALTGLLPYTLYAWEVASVDTTNGLTFTSAFADSITFKTLSDTAHIALTFKGAGSGCNNDTLTYTSSNSAAPYTVTLYRNGVVYGSPLSVTNVASFYNVPPGNYYAKSTGTGSGGSFGLSDTTQIVPPAPTGLDTTMVTPTTATLNWNAISCSNYFTVQYKVTGTTTWKTVTASTNSLMLISLMPDTKYTWQVSASDSFNHQTVTGVYSDTATFITSSVLPVTFVSFNAVLNNNSAVLSWSTSNEINNKGFQVERSNDAAHFNSIGFVDAQFGHSILNYGFTDNNLISGSDYYRLKQIDVDGNYMYSKTIKLDLSRFAWSVNGNPVINNSSYMQLKLDRTATVSIQVISLNGSILQTIHKGNINAGNYTIPLSLNNVSAGMYIVKLMVDKQSYTTKIIKQ